MPSKRQGRRLITDVEKSLLKEIDDSISFIKKQYEDSFETSTSFFNCYQNGSCSNDCLDVDPFTGMELNIPSCLEQKLKIKVENADFQKSIESHLFEGFQPKYNVITDNELTELAATVDDADNYEM